MSFGVHICALLLVVLLYLVTHLKNFLFPKTSVILEVQVCNRRMLHQKHGFNELEIDTAHWQIWGSYDTKQEDRDRDHSTGRDKVSHLTGKLD